MILLHITQRAAWEAAKTRGEYRADSLEADGFIHASLPDQAVGTANLIYRGIPDLVILAIDDERVRVEVKWEPAPDAQVYPHIYGPLNLDAVVAVKPFPPSADGTFVLPDLGAAER
jgi:uncharacterized protein (DUF952 family)